MKHSFRSVLALVIATAPLLQAQGPLAPPGAPAPTVRNTVNHNAGGNLLPAPAAGTNVTPLQQAFSATNPWANLK